MKRIITLIFITILLLLNGCTTQPEETIGRKTLTEAEKEIALLFTQDYDDYSLFEYQTKCCGSIEIAVESYAAGELVNVQRLRSSLGNEHSTHGLGVISICFEESEIHITNRFVDGGGSYSIPIEIPFKPATSITSIFEEKNSSIVRDEKIVLYGRVYWEESEGTFISLPLEGDTQLERYPFCYIVKCMFSQEENVDMPD